MQEVERRKQDGKDGKDGKDAANVSCQEKKSTKFQSIIKKLTIIAVPSYLGYYIPYFV